jgi:hemolysin III
MTSLLPATRPTLPRTWWNRQNRPFDTWEVLADAAVHVVGIVLTLAAGSVLLFVSANHTAPDQFPSLALYLATLIGVLALSLAFNVWPVTKTKQLLARLDQAAIFLFIAGTYTPFLTLMAGTSTATTMMILVWGMSLAGVGLKLIVPHRFGRVAILLYLGIGWSGVLVFQSLAAVVPPSALWLLASGGIVYSVGIIFHLWESLRFQNALWHVAVVSGATLHLAAVLDSMVLSRL